MRVLVKIAHCEPQAAYACFVTGFKHKPSYIIRTIPDINSQLRLLDDFITNEFVPALTNGIRCSDAERYLFSLPVRLGGLVYQFSVRLRTESTKIASC